MHSEADVILRDIMEMIERLVGKQLEHGPDALIGAHFGVTGWDGIELLEEMEAKYAIDLRPFVEARGKNERFLFWKVKVGGDATPRQVAQHIAGLLSPR